MAESLSSRSVRDAGRGDYQGPDIDAFKETNWDVESLFSRHFVCEDTGIEGTEDDWDAQSDAVTLTEDFHESRISRILLQQPAKHVYNLARSYHMLHFATSLHLTPAAASPGTAYHTSKMSFMHKFHLPTGFKIHPKAAPLPLSSCSSSPSSYSSSGQPSSYGEVHYDGRGISFAHWSITHHDASGATTRTQRIDRVGFRRHYRCSVTSTAGHGEVQHHTWARSELVWRGDGQIGAVVETGKIPGREDANLVCYAQDGEVPVAVWEDSCWEESVLGRLHVLEELHEEEGLEVVCSCLGIVLTERQELTGPGVGK